MFCWPCISIYSRTETQLDAQLILSIFRQSTSTCFGRISSPSSGGTPLTVSCRGPTRTTDSQRKTTICTNCCTGVLMSSKPDLLPDVFCLMVRIFRLMLVLFYLYLNSTNIPPFMIINRIYETQNLLSL